MFFRIYKKNPNATWVIDVKAGERVLYDVLGVGAVELLAEQREEHCEVDGPRRLRDHLLQVVVGGVLP